MIESFPYSVEPWMPPLTDGVYCDDGQMVWDAHSGFIVLANHATDPVPISTTIRKCASEFKKVCLYVIVTTLCLDG